ncbi:MAG: GGDEF domain-containing protein [Butyrivibrio sp.]|nr:GGDEF domain-containing protein [Butyrivibrio sp.]
MKSEFYDKKKRAHIYRSIYTYKIVTLCVILALNFILAGFFFKNVDLYYIYSDSLTPYYTIVGLRLTIFIASIIIDIYILKRTASIEKRLSTLAFLDKLTGLPNRYSCDLLIQGYNDSPKLQSLGFILMQLNNLKAINSGSGHKYGNNLIAEFSSILEDVGNDYGYIGRNGGNEFIVLLEDCDNTKIDMFLMDLTKRIHGYNELYVGAPMEVSYSKVLNSLEHMDKITDVISLGYWRIHEIPQILS